jgi:hypothetical protein
VKFGWLKYLRLPFEIRRGYVIGELLSQSQNLISQASYLDSLNTSQEIVKIGKDKLYEARIFEGIALSHLDRKEESAIAFSKAIFLIKNSKTLSKFDKNYLVAYCFSFFKERGWPSAIARPSDFPDLPALKKVSAKIFKKFPFEDYPN